MEVKWARGARPLRPAVIVSGAVVAVALSLTGCGGSSKASVHAQACGTGHTAANVPVEIEVNRGQVSCAAAMGLQELAFDLRNKGAVLFTVTHEQMEHALPALVPDQPDADAICQIQSFYRLAVQLASARGIDADRPRHLQKVTRTR